MADKPPPHPPQQAKHPGRPRISPHAQARHHQKTMRRPNEKLHLARHGLHGHTPKPNPDQP